MSLPNCHFCGKFVGWKLGYVTWVPYGTCLDLEPPDPEFAHVRCWEANPSSQALLNEYTWMKPAHYGGPEDGTSQ